MNRRQADIEAYLDGLLDLERAAALERDLESDPELARELELARRISSSLRSTFAPPETARLTALLPSSDPEPPSAAAEAVETRASFAFLLVPLTLAAAAAAVLLLLDVPGRSPAGPATNGELAERLELPRSDGGEGADNGAPSAPSSRVAALEPALDPFVGPLLDARSEEFLVRVQRPDLEALWEKAALWTSDPGLRTCDTDDDVAGLLASALDQDVELDAEANGLLQGPFSDESWPTGTILAGLSDGQASVLIAERDEVVTCCLDLEAPAGDLNVYSWPVGDVVLTEITPHTEPRLLGLFPAYRDSGQVR